MKIIAIILALLVPAVGLAAPFLVCDPYPATDIQPSEFRITYGTITIISPAFVNADNSVQLKWDLGPLSNGTYNINVTAAKVDPVWGTQESSPTPFSFTKPASTSPRLPASLRLQR